MYKLASFMLDKEVEEYGRGTYDDMKILRHYIFGDLDDFESWGIYIVDILPSTGRVVSC